MLCVKRLAIMMLCDDEYEENLFEIYSSRCKQRKKMSPIIDAREEEGSFAILISKHLFSNEDNFVKYFRITPHLFDIILQHVHDDIVKHPYNRVKKPISPQQKLCLTLR